MAYSSLSDVKEVLRIDASDTESDTELTNCITSGDRLLNGFQKFHGFRAAFSSPKSYGYVCVKATEV
jgi:hypothetical protein